MVQSVQERRHCACHPPTLEYLPPALHFLSEFPLSMHRAVQSFLMPYCYFVVRSGRLYILFEFVQAIIGLQ